MNRFLYYIIILPVSKLPFWLLYMMSDIVYFFVYHLFGYRKKVVRSNIKNSFPNKSDRELQSIERKSYKHLSRILLEGIKNISISKDELLKRMVVENPEVMEALFKKGKSVLLAGAHYQNWEYLITAQNLLFDHQAVGIGRTISNSYLDQKMTERRSRFGMRIVTSSTVRESMEKWKDEKIAVLVLFDQSPRKERRAYWTEFLGRQTAFFFGTEKMAVTYDMAVVQFTMVQAGKGHYRLQLELISENPRSEEYGFITETLVKNLENQIQKEPAYWLWSHKRWKKKVPKDVDALKASLREKHEEWMRGIDN